MAATAKCLYDKKGVFTKGTAYPVLAFGESGAVVKDDGGKVSHIGYSTFNDDKAWAVSYEDDKSAEKSKSYSKEGTAS